MGLVGPVSATLPSETTLGGVFESWGILLAPLPLILLLTLAIAYEMAFKCLAQVFARTSKKSKTKHPCTS